MITVSSKSLFWCNQDLSLYISHTSILVKDKIVSNLRFSGICTTGLLWHLRVVASIQLSRLHFMVLCGVGKMHIRVSTVIKESKPLHAG